MDFIFGGFNGKKLKPQLKMAVGRFQIASNKKSALTKQQMREIAVMLAEEPPKEEKAKIRAEALIREDNAIEAYDILQLNCELLAERIKLLEHTKECPPDLVSCVSTLIWATDRVDIPELVLIRKQFRSKYGNPFEEAALNNVGGVLNERVVSKLSVQPPAAYLVQTYLERICEQFEVDWKPKVRLTAEEMAEPTAAPVGYSVEVAAGTGLGAVSVITGQPHTDEEIGYVPPPPASKQDYLPAAPGQNDQEAEVIIPQPDVFVPPPPASSATSQKNDDDDFGDVDIFIPAIPTAPPGSKDNDDKGDGNNLDIPPAPGQSSSSGNASASVGSSYADLAARFEQLKK